MWIEKLAVALALVMPFQGNAEESKKIQDNSFLLEEAYNQEAEVVQHIQSFMYMKRSKDWVYTFTQEWPVPDETHQLSGPRAGLADLIRSGLNVRLLVEQTVQHQPR